jgi:hypothetical protein
MPCCLERAQGAVSNLLNSQSAFYAFGFDLLFHPEDGGGMFVRSVVISPEYTALDSRRPYSLLKYIIWIY